jgi:predicted phosphodiesterase/uncharacterized Fe-S cluster-containing radical SAM superfamily protein
MDDRSTDGALFLFGGPYSNLEATQAALAAAERLGVPPERVICTGDVAAYGADAKACVALVRRSGIHVVMGNCEQRLAEGAGDCGCGFAPGSACDRLSEAWFTHASAELDADDRAWLGSLPQRLDIAFARLRLAVVHATLDDISRFVFSSTPRPVKALDLAASSADALIVGHCGLPFSQAIDGKLWHNPGAAGMPANDGTPDGWYSLLIPGEAPRTLRIEHRRLGYDHATAARKMRAAGLPEGYADALSTGLWPSCDVLPPDERRRSGAPIAEASLLWRRDEPAAALDWPSAAEPRRLDPRKFRDPATTAGGERRAQVALGGLETLWINTGTLCNLACATCYIESTPRNDRLAYIGAADVAGFLDEIAARHPETQTIGFTGGEPFMNRALPAMLGDALSRGHEALVLTNAMKPMRRREAELLALRRRYGGALTLRVSLDHYDQALHEAERGPGSWEPAIAGLAWLAQEGFSIAVAGRLFSGETETVVRAGYRRLFERLGMTLDADDPAVLTLFPDMDERADVPEITEACWGILGKSPADVMCASSRMVVKRKGADRPAVLACTLLAYDPAFELGATLEEASGAVSLNHPHCAKFCVLGGASCKAA